MTIIISGASGDLGRQVTANLFEKVSPSEVTLLTRNPDSLADAAEKGAKIVKANFDDDCDTLAESLKGGEAMLLISTLSIGRRLEQHTNAIEAAKKAGVKHLIYTSSIGIQPQTPSISGQEHYATEQVLRNSGLTYTILRDGWYADVIPMLMLKSAIEMGSIVASTGNGHVAPVAKKDCALAAACVLAEPEKHANAIYEITGPDLMTFAEITKACADVTGKEIAYVNVSHDEKKAIFDSMGVNDDYEEGMMNDNTGAWASNEMITYEMAIKQHYFAICSHHVELITGQPATPYKEVVEGYRAFWE